MQNHIKFILLNIKTLVTSIYRCNHFSLGSLIVKCPPQMSASWLRLGLVPLTGAQGGWGLSAVEAVSQSEASMAGHWPIRGQYWRLEGWAGEPDAASGDSGGPAWDSVVTRCHRGGGGGTAWCQAQPNVRRSRMGSRGSPGNTEGAGETQFITHRENPRQGG